ncbi:hypothetical protein COOONC_23151 [Cooperia oncophora]
MVRKRFVKWSATDSLYGSRHLAEKLEESGEIEKIDVLMLLDLLGAANPTIPNAKGLGATELFDYLPSIEKELHRLGCSYVSRDVFLARKTSATPKDDHVPFLNRGVPVLHLIPIPFPKVWHTADDNEKALHYPTIYHVMAVIRVFVAKYLGITKL